MRRNSGVEVDDRTRITKLGRKQLVQRCLNLSAVLKETNKISNYWRNKATIVSETAEQHEYLFQYVKSSFFL